MTVFARRFRGLEPCRGPRARSGGCRRWALVATSTALLAACAAPPRVAHDWNARAIEQVALVPDTELAAMRGRFVQAGQVQHFGIQMFSSWLTEQGVLMNAALEWSADRNGNVQTPTVRFYHQAPDLDGGPAAVTLADLARADPLQALRFLNSGGLSLPAPTPLPATAGAGGLETARGAVQSVQAAGDRNSIGNDMRFNVTEGAAIVPPAAAPAALGTPQPLTETTTVQFDTGAKATAFIEPNAIGLAVKIGSSGSILQEIRGGVGRAAQHVNVRSNVNVIRNGMTVNFGLAPRVGILRANINAALNLTRGLRQ